MSMRFVECYRCSGKGRVPGVMWGYDPCDSCAAQGGRYVDDTPAVLPITEADVRRIVREELALLTGDTGRG